MTKQKEIYKCEICGNIVEVLHDGVGTLVCCGQPMKLQVENGKGEYAEKHAPIFEGNLVKIGKIEHPMEKEHYIEWIEAESPDGEIAKVFLKPKQKPQAKFNFKPVKARMYCNIHGLWKNKNS